MEPEEHAAAEPVPPMPPESPAWAVALAVRLDNLDLLVRPLVTRYRHLLDRLDGPGIAGRVVMGRRASRVKS